MPLHYSHTLSAGWNMVGPLSSNVSVESLANIRAVFGWTRTQYEYLTGPMELEQTKGYWILTDRITIVQM